MQAIVFDLGGTLLDPSSEFDAYVAFLQEVAEAIDLPLAPAELVPRVEALLADVAPSQVQHWTPLRELIPQCVARVAAAEGSELPPETWPDWWHRFVTLHGEHARSFPEVAEALAEADRLGYRRGLLSDGDGDDIEEILNALGLLGAFDPMLTSEQIGVGKPNPRAFESALGRLRLPPNEVTYIGDSYERDIAGATAVGMRAVHVVREGDSPHPLHARDLVSAVRLAAPDAENENHGDRV